MFVLDSRLSRDSHLVSQWSVCDVWFKNNAYFPWLLLIPRYNNITEIHQLKDQDQLDLMKEITRASGLFKEYTQADKMNVAAIGNQVSQLHIHVVARFQHDKLWPQSIWQENTPNKPYETQTLETHLRKLKILLKNN